MISFRSVLVLGGLCVLALIVSAIAKGKHKKTEDISLNVFVVLVLATFGMAAVWLLKVSTHGVRYVVHEVQTEKNQREEQQLKEEAERRKRESAAAQQAQTSKQTQPVPPADATAPNFDGAGVWAALLTQTFRKQGSDVTVDGFEHTLIFDCTRELNPRTSCYVLYKTYPKNREEAKLLVEMGIYTLRYKTEDGLLSGFTWTKRLP